MRAVAAAFCFTAVTVFAAPSSAQSLTANQEPNATEQSIAAAALSAQRTGTTLTPAAASKKRPAALMPLYGAYAALQISDAALTTKALGIGGHESNSLMAGIVKHPIALYSIKAAVVGVAVFQSEKMWRQGKRRSAIATLIIVNAMYVFVVNHNRQTIAKLSR